MQTATHQSPEAKQAATGPAFVPLDRETRPAVDTAAAAYYLSRQPQTLRGWACAGTYLCEGIGQAWACWKATGAAAVVCFGWGRVRGVAADLRQRDALARLVLVPDRGKEDEAETIAREVRGEFVTMPSDTPPNFDANDYAAANGHDALEVLLAGASEPPQPEPRYRLLNPADLQALPPLAWCVRGVLPAVGVAAQFGPSASGKSFLAFDLAAHIAEGREWFGHRVTAAPVVYVALEGEAGFKLRADAWEQAHGRRLPAALRLVLQGFKLTGDVPDLAAAILAAVGAGAVVFVDTLNRAAPMADENSSRDMGEILEGAKELQRLTAGLVVLIHHTGNRGDLSAAERMLNAQAVALNTIFAEMARIAHCNLFKVPDVADRYLRLALKAQSQSRATVETLAAIKNPPVVFARQANIAHGPQQVNNGPAPNSTPASAHPGETVSAPTELLEDSTHGSTPLDTRATKAASRTHPQLEPVGALDRPAHR